MRYSWESHLDLPMTEGARGYLPAAWLVEALNLVVKPDAGGSLDNVEGKRLFELRDPDDDHIVLLEGKALESLAASQGLSCIWFLIAERNAYPGGMNELAHWRRMEGIAWLQDGVSWSDATGWRIAQDLASGTTPGATKSRLPT